MLVVLGIIAVLAGILVPVMVRARAGARRATCVTHISEIAKAARMYADDYDRTIVPARTAFTGLGTKGITWCVLLQPYLGSEEILKCSADSSPAMAANSTCLPHSYGINYSLAYNSMYATYPFTVSIGTVQRPSDTILFFELKGSAASMGSSFYSSDVSRVDARHNDFGNFAFLDGHVKGMRAKDVRSPVLWDPYYGGM
jgi:prepilin-type processing-associated H-X9-DG protein